MAHKIKNQIPVPDLKTKTMSSPKRSIQTCTAGDSKKKKVTCGCKRMDDDQLAFVCANVGDQLSPTTVMSSTVSFSNLREELLLSVAGYLSPRDLLRFQCVSKELSHLNTESIWERRCEERWKPWPRYQLTDKKRIELDSAGSATFRMAWKRRYKVIEEDATRNTLRSHDLQNLKWYLSFVLSGIRGEGRSDHVPVEFAFGEVLLVPGYPPLSYQIINETPPSTDDHIRQNLRGDQPFSRKQYLGISNFPPHFISRKSSDAEWLIVNQSVMMVSRGEI